MRNQPLLGLEKEAGLKRDPSLRNLFAAAGETPGVPAAFDGGGRDAAPDARRPPGAVLVEVFIVVLVLSLIYSILIILVKPDEIKKKSRDLVRVGDLNKLSVAVESYVADKGSPPDSVNVTRVSLSAVGNGPLADSRGQGWIGQDLSKYSENLPLDPVNVNPYFYRYRTDGVKYEIDARLEHYTGLSADDNGNDNDWYEKGTDLTIL